jgi:alpha-tubulin suppressor-like RCC1 family protein
MGQGTLGELGLGDDRGRESPEQISTEDIIDIYTGYNFSMIYLYSRMVCTFGENRHAQLCLGHRNTMYEEPRYSFNCQHFNIEPSGISLGGQHGLAVTTQGQVYAWGSNLRGQVGVNTKKLYASELKHVKSLSKHNIVSVHAGYCHSMALSDHGELFLWVSVFGVHINDIG